MLLKVTFIFTPQIHVLTLRPFMEFFYMPFGLPDPLGQSWAVAFGDGNRVA
jgi:hypothetical protein